MCWLKWDERVHIYVFVQLQFVSKVQKLAWSSENQKSLTFTITLISNGDLTKRIAEEQPRDLPNTTEGEK